MSQLRPQHPDAARAPLSPPPENSVSAAPRRACGAVCQSCRLAQTCGAAASRTFTDLFPSTLLLLPSSTLT